MKIKKGDNVLVISGKEKGKTGRILVVNREKSRAIVSGLNIVHRSVKPRSAEEKGGIKKQEGTIHASNLQVICGECNKATRIAHKFEGDKKFRVCKKCGASLDKDQTVKKETKKATAKKPAAKTASASTKKESAKTSTTATKKTTTTTKSAEKKSASTNKTTTKTTAKKTASTTAKKSASTTAKKTASTATKSVTKKAPAKTASKNTSVRKAGSK